MLNLFYLTPCPISPPTRVGDSACSHGMTLSLTLMTRNASRLSRSQAVMQFDGDAFQTKLIRHVRRWRLAHLLAASAFVWFHAHYTLGCWRRPIIEPPRRQFTEPV